MLRPWPSDERQDELMERAQKFLASTPPETVTVTRDGEWFVVSDENGEFARATTVEQALPYVRDLLYGPGTSF